MHHHRPFGTSHNYTCAGKNSILAVPKYMLNTLIFFPIRVTHLVKPHPLLNVEFASKRSFYELSHLSHQGRCTAGDGKETLSVVFFGA
jgi:hypothetical protein